MTKITFNDAELEQMYSVGDWFVFSDGGLCVLAQTKAASIQAIMISEEDANRKNSNVLIPHIAIDKISKAELNNLFNTTDWQKVSVEIIVNK